MNPFHYFGRLWQFIVGAAKEVFMRILLTICLFCGYVILSMIIYAAVRHILVPRKTHVLPVHLMFNPSCQEGTSLPPPRYTNDFIAPTMPPPTSYPSPLHCTYPFAEFYLSDGKRLLSPGHFYTITVELDLPESPENSQIGMFMVNLTLYSYTGGQIAASIKPTILRYKSSLLQIFSTVFYSLPLVLGLTEEKQKQSIVMFDDYQEPFTEGSIYARVTILSHKIQLYNVELTFDAIFSGLAYYLYYWPISMTAIIVSGIFFSFIAVTLMMWARRALERWNRLTRRRRSSGQRMQLRAPELAPIHEEEEEEEEEERRGLNEGHVEDLSTSEGTPTRTNTHDSDSIISSATEVTVSDLSELDDHLQQLRGQLQSSPNGSGNSTPMTTEDKSEQDVNLRRRTT